MNRKLFVLGLIVLLTILLGAGGKSVYGQGSANYDLATSGSMASIGPRTVAESLGTGFTYQGYLESGGVAVNSTCDFQFKLYASSGDADQVGDMDEHTSIEVDDGIFTIPDLDFDEGAFNGEARYLEINVRCGGGGRETLTPRQEITPAPYALALPGLRTQQSYTSPNVLGGHTLNSVTQGVVGSVISGGGYFDDPPESNFISDNYGVIGGGSGNLAGNNSGGVSDAAYATVGGGHSNKALNTGATVAGGTINEAYYRATVGGGYGNIASGGYSTIPGGHSNRATASRSFAAGYQAQAIHSSSFVWADGLGVPFASTNDNQFLIRAENGVGIGTNEPLSELHVIGRGRFDVGTGSVNITTPGGWPGIIAYSQINNRREIIFKDDRLLILTSEDDTPSPNTSGIIINNQGDVGIGVYSPGAKLDVNGTARTEVLQITGGADLAEPFEILGVENVQPGMLVAIDPEHPGQLRIADDAYDVKVAGCVSGANGLQPGLVMEGLDGTADGSLPVALTGRVYCWADASHGAIQPGDLLTSSDTPGHVMVVKDHEAALGAIIGKAMSALDEGRDLILVLVALQ
jgi:hypothetical protein